MRACTFDLETSNLNANFGIILCACLKPTGAPNQHTAVKTFRGDHYKTWKNRRSNDGLLAKDLYRELKKYDVWVAHNGLSFDINFLRTRLARVGVEMAQPKIFDPVRIARRYMRLGYNSLEQVAESVGVYRDFPEYRKTRVEPDIWLKATLDGSPRAMDYIVRHCEIDVRLLEVVAERLGYLAPKITGYGSDT